MAKRKPSDRSPSPSTPSRPSPSRPASPSTPSRGVTPSVTSPAKSHAERLASERAQRDIYDARNAAARSDSLHNAHGVLSRTPAHLANPAARTLADLDAAKKLARQKELKRGLIKKSRLGQEGALTNKPERTALRSTDKLRALKCKSRPKPKNPRRGKGGGGSKRFVPWC